MNNQVLSVLLHIKDKYGSNVFKKDSKIKAYLNDLLPESEMKRVKKLIINSINDLDAYFLIKNTPEGNRIFIIERLIFQMNEDYGVSREYAEETIWLIAGVLGYAKSGKVSETVSKIPIEKSLEISNVIKTSVEKIAEKTSETISQASSGKTSESPIALKTAWEIFLEKRQNVPTISAEQTLPPTKSLGNNYFNYADAIERYSEDIALNHQSVEDLIPRWGSHYNDLRRILGNDNKVEEFKRKVHDLAIDKIAKFSPQNTKECINRGDFYKERNQHDLAIADYSKAIECLCARKPIRFSH